MTFIFLHFCPLVVCELFLDSFGYLFVFYILYICIISTTSLFISQNIIITQYLFLLPTFSFLAKFLFNFHNFLTFSVNI